MHGLIVQRLAPWILIPVTWVRIPVGPFFTHLKTYRQIFGRSEAFERHRPLRLRTVWPSGLRRCVQAAVRKGVGSNPTAVNFFTYNASGKITSLKPGSRLDHFLVVKPPQKILERRCAAVKSLRRSLSVGAGAKKSKKLRHYIFGICAPYHKKITSK